MGLFHGVSRVVHHRRTSASSPPLAAGYSVSSAQPVNTCSLGIPMLRGECPTVSLKDAQILIFITCPPSLFLPQQVTLEFYFAVGC